MGLACLLQTWGHGRWKKTRVEPRSSDQAHAKRIFVCYLFRKTVGFVMEKFLRREKGWFWKLKKKKTIPHFLGQEMLSQLKVSLDKPVVHLHLSFALTFKSKRKGNKIRSVSDGSVSLSLMAPS